MKACPFCAEDIQDAAIICKHCGRDLTPQAAPQQKGHPIRNTIVFLLGAFVLLVIVAAMSGSANNHTPPVLTARHVETLQAVHRTHGWDQPANVELRSDGMLVLDYELTDRASTLPKTFGESRLLAVREALLPFGFEEYRVNVNAPKPGTGLTARYGSARIFRNGSLEWLTR